MQQRVLAFEIQTQRQRANKRLNSLNQRMLRAEKTNTRKLGLDYGGKQIFGAGGATCQIFDECEKSVMKQFVLTTDPKLLEAFPPFLSLTALKYTHSMPSLTPISQDEVKRHQYDTLK